jgi:hypothetical protein
MCAIVTAILRKKEIHYKQGLAMVVHYKQGLAIVVPSPSTQQTIRFRYSCVALTTLQYLSQCAVLAVGSETGGWGC